jgi:hypothetical protein
VAFVILLCSQFTVVMITNLSGWNKSTEVFFSLRLSEESASLVRPVHTIQSNRDSVRKLILTIENRNARPTAPTPSSLLAAGTYDVILACFPQSTALNCEPQNDAFSSAIFFFFVVVNVVVVLLIVSWSQTSHRSRNSLRPVRFVRFPFVPEVAYLLEPHPSTSLWQPPKPFDLLTVLCSTS